MTSKQFVFILVLALTTLIFAGCAAGTEIGIPNPAAVHCEDQGYSYEIRTAPDGGQYGVCIFPDGSECDGWAFFRGECGPGQGGYQPLSPTQCEELANAAQQTLGVEVMTSEAPFEDYVSGEEGTGCQVTATGTGLEFESYWSVAEELKAMLADRGWQEDMKYAADGPTGTAAGVRKEGGLCLLNVSWKPSDDADCPEDQPIATCELQPEQQLYSIVLNCAEAAAGEAYAGWSTYTSETFGHTLQYPGDAEIMGADRLTRSRGVNGERW